MRQWIMAIALGIALVTGLAACGAFGEAHNYNAPSPSRNVVQRWTRLETPYHYNTIIFSCHGKDGLYEDLANDNSVEVVPNDPEC